MYTDGVLVQPLGAQIDDFAVYPGALTGAEYASAAADMPCARGFEGDGFVYFGQNPGALLNNSAKLPNPLPPDGTDWVETNACMRWTQKAAVLDQYLRAYRNIKCPDYVCAKYRPEATQPYNWRVLCDLQTELETFKNGQPRKHWDAVLDRVSLYSKSIKVSGRDWTSAGTGPANECTKGRGSHPPIAHCGMKLLDVIPSLADAPLRKVLRKFDAKTKTQT